MTDEQWHRAFFATLLLGAAGGCLYFVFMVVASMFGPLSVPIAIIVMAILAGRAIGKHTTWNFGEERARKPALFIRVPPSVIEAMMREPQCEHQVTLSNQPKVDAPLITLAVTCVEPDH